MQIEKTQFVPASPEKTWVALNDPDVLRQCIPGCETIERISECDYKVVMQAKVGPVSARFTGKLGLSDLQPPESYTVRFEGQGGAVGFGKGSARVALSGSDGGTTLLYAVQATVGGRLAQIGSRLIDGAAIKLADDFFARFVEVVASEPQPAPVVLTQAATPPAPAGTRWRPALWASVAIAGAVGAAWLALKH